MTSELMRPYNKPSHDDNDLVVSRRLARWFFVASLWASNWVAVESFPSCPPPRFDVFGEQILGSWKYDAKQEPQSVEEVMRSCGGAVQGIREISRGEEGIYLNRADDGFLFWDCGSFVHIPISDLMTTGNTLSASLAVNEKIRIRISATLDSTGVKANQISKYLKVSSSADKAGSYHSII